MILDGKVTSGLAASATSRRKRVTTLPRMTVEPPLVLDRGGPGPMAVQITGQLRAAVAGSRLRAGERLPSSRSLAASLGVSRTVVTDAYLQLFAEGWLEGRHGSGTYVAQGAAGGPAVLARPAIPEEAGPAPGNGSGRIGSDGSGRVGGDRPGRAGGDGAGRAGRDRAGLAARDEGRALTEMRPGIPWVAGIDQAAWRRAWRRAGDAAPSQWPDPRGLPPLREALCG